jgi:hypothetical protein
MLLCTYHSLNLNALLLSVKQTHYNIFSELLWMVHTIFASKCRARHLKCNLQECRNHKGRQVWIPAHYLGKRVENASLFPAQCGDNAHRTQFIPLSAWFVRGAGLSKLTNEKWPLEEAIFPECYYTSMHFQINNPSELPQERRLLGQGCSLPGLALPKLISAPISALYNK